MKKIKIFNGFTYFMFVAPAILLYTIFLLYPAFQAFTLSLYKWDGGIHKTFIGLKNFTDMLGDENLLFSLRNTMFFLLAGEFVIVPLSFIFAVIVNEKIRGFRIFRTIIYIPNIISEIAVAIIWYFILNSGTSGILNAFLVSTGHASLQRGWLIDNNIVMYISILPFMWAYSSANMLIFLGHLKSIPNDIYEAAAIDGVNGFSKLFSITIPLSLETIKAIVILTVCSSMQTVGIVLGLTGGGPAGASNTIGTYIYQKAYQEYFFGYSTAISVVLLLISMFVVLIITKFFKTDNLN